MNSHFTNKSIKEKKGVKADKANLNLVRPTYIPSNRKKHEKKLKIFYIK